MLMLSGWDQCTQTLLEELTLLSALPFPALLSVMGRMRWMSVRTIYRPVEVGAAAPAHNDWARSKSPGHKTRSN